MDAEIGVRNLGDTFRYNVLPNVVQALRLDEEALADADSFEDLPEYQQLAMLVCCFQIRAAMVAEMLFIVSSSDGA